MGSRGEVPPNQELLDWLAIEFMDNGWDVKHMIRLMVTSSAYRQSSLPRPEVDAIDPDNRLVARQSRFRLEAEQIRDNALAVSGLLVNKLGGDIVRPYQPAKYYAPLNFPERDYTASTGEDQFRRAVYTHWQRQFLHPFLLAFDAPIARRMHGAAADLEHADRGAGAAERSVVRRSGPALAAKILDKVAGRRRQANSLGLAAGARPRRIAGRERGAREAAGQASQRIRGRHQGGRAQF